MKRLIVVADNSLIVRAVRLGVRESDGFEILSYVCGRDGGAGRIVDAAPDVVLIDDMDEADHVIDLIRDLKELADKLVVMVLTVRVRGAWAERALGAGASGAISKSIQPIALGTLVRESVKGHIVHAPTAVALASGKTTDDASAEPSCLTTRELEILRLAAAGDTNGKIARKLWVTEATVKFHLRNIYRKLDLGNRTEACHYAHVNGLLAKPEVADSVPVQELSASEFSAA
jgi:DNA-binding NarL/FixJ family response regulator